MHNIGRKYAIYMTHIRLCFTIVIIGKIVEYLCACKHDQKHFHTSVSALNNVELFACSSDESPELMKSCVIEEIDCPCCRDNKFHFHLICTQCTGLLNNVN